MSWQSHRFSYTTLFDVLKNHGEIWVGRPKKEVIKSKLKIQLVNFINDLINYNETLTTWKKIEKIPTIDLQLELIHQIQDLQNWQWPGILINDTWHTGNTRILASAFKWANPHKHFWMFAPFCQNRPQDLDKPMLINNPMQLKSWFNLPEDANDIEDNFFVDINLQEKLLHFRKLSHASQELVCGSLYRYCHWAQRNKKPRIEVFTDWPEQIQDSGNFWTIEIAGPSPWIPSHLPGAIDGFTWRHKWKPDIDYVMHVRSANPIDLSYLLPWMESDYKQYTDADWTFTVGYKHGKSQTKFITMFDFNTLYFT